MSASSRGSLEFALSSRLFVTLAYRRLKMVVGMFMFCAERFVATCIFFLKGSASSLHVHVLCCRARGRCMHFLQKGRAHRRYMCMFCAERFVATCLFIAIRMHILIIPCMRTLGSNCVFLLACLCYAAISGVVLFDSHGRSQARWYLDGV